jgi:O-antigen/teichoic acid export membrane protein
VEHSDSSKSEEKSVSRAAGVVGFYTFLSRILGLIRDMVLAALFGSGMAADAFFVAFRIPNLLRRLFAEGSLTIAFIPVFTEYLTTRTKKDAFDLARIVLTLLTISLVIVTVLGVLFSPWIVRIQAFGFGGSGVKYDLTVLLTRITFPYIFFISIVAFFMGVLNSLRHFASPAAAPIFLNVGIIGAAYFISPSWRYPSGLFANSLDRKKGPQAVSSVAARAPGCEKDWVSYASCHFRICCIPVEQLYRDPPCFVSGRRKRLVALLCRPPCPVPPGSICNRH